MKTSAFVLAAAALTFATTAGAGYKTDQPVVINDASKFFYGSYATARSSAGTSSQLGCTVDVINGAEHAQCWATSAAGVYRNCSRP